jgi:formylmethanofuran dehydrogenase subunit E
MSWKKYGGYKNLQDFNNMTVNSLVTDTIVIRKAFNSFTVDGALVVNGTIYGYGDLNLTGVGRFGNIFVDTVATIQNLTVVNDFDILKDIIVTGKVYFDQQKDVYNGSHFVEVCKSSSIYSPFEI